MMTTPFVAKRTQSLDSRWKCVAVRSRVCDVFDASVLCSTRRYRRVLQHDTLIGRAAFEDRDENGLTHAAVLLWGVGL